MGEERAVRARALVPRVHVPCAPCVSFLFCCPVFRLTYTHTHACARARALLAAHCLPACLSACFAFALLRSRTRAFDTCTYIHPSLSSSLLLSFSPVSTSTCVTVLQASPSPRALLQQSTSTPYHPQISMRHEAPATRSLSLPSFLPRPRQSPYLHSTRARPVRIWRARSQVGLAVHQQRSVSCSCSAIVHCRRESGPPRACI